MSDEDWNFPEGRFLSYVLAPPRAGGEPLLLVLNATPDGDRGHAAALARCRRTGAACSTPRPIRRSPRTVRSVRAAKAQGAALARSWRSRASHDAARPASAPLIDTGRRHVPALGAGARSASSWCATGRMPMPRCDDGWFETDAARRGRRHALQLSHRRRDRRARPGVALPARRRARPERGDRSGAMRWQTRRLERPALARMRVPRTARRHLHAGAARFAAAIDKLDHVAATGITAIELMPVADFPGRWNWGYDGVLLFAPDSSLRPPGRSQGADRRRACARPDGVPRRRLQSLRPGGKLSRPPTRRSSSRAAETPWGSAIDYEHPTVRASPSRTRCTGSTSIASTACGSMPSTPSPSPDAAVAARGAEPGGRRACGARPAATSIWCWRTTTTSASLLDPRGRSAARPIPRAMERRLSPRLSRSADRRNRGLLRRLSRRARPRRAHAGRGLCLSGRALAPSQRRAARRAESARCRRPRFVNFLQNHDQIGNRALRRAADRARAAGRA